MAIPERTKKALDLWSQHAAPPPEHMGSFQRAVLSNDLQAAYRYADDENLAAMRDIVLYVYNYVPSAAHGSVEKLRAWHSAHGRKVAA